MADFNAVVAGGIQGHGISSIAPEYIRNSVQDHIPKRDVFDPTLQALIGTHTHVAKDSGPSYVYPARIEERYFNIFYNRVEISPVYISAGLVITRKRFTVHISNLYFENRVLTDLLLTNADGITIEGLPNTPISLKPLQSIQFTIYVEIEGPPSINTLLDYRFDNPLDNSTTQIVGTRVVLYPYEFSSVDMVESLSFSTNVIKSKNGVEQRIQNRNTARRKLKIQSYAGPSENARLGNILYGARGKQIVVPIFQEKRQVTFDIEPLSDTIPVNTRWGSFFIGGLGVIYESSRVYDVFEITGLTDTHITTRQPLSRAYSSKALVAPVAPCRMSNNPIREISGYQSTGRVSFDLIENHQLVIQGNLPSQYGGLDVLYDNFFEVLSKGEDNWKYERRIDVVDYGTGPISFGSPWKYTEIAKEIRFVVVGLENIWKFRGWLNKVKGKRLEFWVPTYDYDFHVLNDGYLQSSILIDNNEHTSMAMDRKHLMFTKKDGSFIFREIVGSDVDISGRVEIAMKDPIDIDVKDLDSVRYLGICRFDTDTVNIRWYQNETITCDIPLKEIKPQ